MADQNGEAEDLNPHKQLLVEAAAEIRADQIAREKACPQNVGEGTVRLVRSTIGGVALGAATAVMGPVRGYTESGTRGIVSGTLGGLAAGIVTTALGVGSGIASFTQGASRSAQKVNPPSKDPRFEIEDLDLSDDPALFEGNARLSRDGTARAIKSSYLAERKRLYGDILAQHSAESAASSMDGLAPPVDTDLYTTLGADVNSTPAEIRKAYYRMAQKYHPDKHQGDPEATEKFQKVGNAYQILSNPTKREEYHRIGMAAADSEAMMDPKALFALMFADFEHIVGDLATATILGAESFSDGSVPTEDDADENLTAERERNKQIHDQKRKKFQTMREAHLARLLNKRLEPWLSGDEESFIRHAKQEVIYLRGEPFGRDCLRSAGYIYRKKALRLIDNAGPFSGIANFFEDLGDKAHNVKSQFRALEGGIKAVTESATANDDESIDEKQRREAISTLGAVWLASVVDIESTLRNVVALVLHLDDPAMSKDDEILRKARGLVVLSKIFSQA